MDQSEHDRRRSIRQMASYRASLISPDGETLAEGMTTNFSDEGAFVVLRAAPGLPQDGEALLEVDLAGREGAEDEVVRRRCRIVRYRSMGGLTGLGLEFINADQ